MSRTILILLMCTDCDDECWETRPEMEQRQGRTVIPPPAVREVNKDFEITNEIRQ